jgi:YVTN family beta-propeller protein
VRGKLGRKILDEEHDMTRRFSTAWLGLAMAGLVGAAAAAEQGRYLGPTGLAVARDGKSLVVLESDARQIAVIDAVSGKVVRTAGTPAVPTGLAQSLDGATWYVTGGGPRGTVSVIDAATGRLSAAIPAGHTPGGPSLSPDGRRLYVCNRFQNDVSVIDLVARKELARVPMVREPIASAVTPDGKTLVVANLVPLDRADSYDVAAAVSLVDTATLRAVHLRLPNGSASVRGVCLSPDGRWAYLAHILSRYQMPTTQLERGWMNTNALSIVDLAAKKLLNTVLLDDVDLGAANPYGVACTADGKQICVSHAGSGELSVIDAAALMAKLARVAARAGRPIKPEEQAEYSSPTPADVPNDLAFLVGLRERVKLQGHGARYLAVAGEKAYVACYFSDALDVVDLQSQPPRQTGSVALGPVPVLGTARRGHMLFTDADLCFQHWQSCESCHPDARADGLNWDLLNDGLGNPKNTKSMLLSHRTPPAMWEAVRPTAESAVRSGITHIQFSVRPEADARAIDEYLKSLTPVESPHLVRGRLSDSAQRGKTLFFNERGGCYRCHPAPLYTDLKMHDVHSKGQYDRRSDFDTPSLVECWRTAPYLHDGHYTTVKELLREGKHGALDDPGQALTPQELDDLVEFVLSL